MEELFSQLLRGMLIGVGVLTLFVCAVLPP